MFQGYLTALITPFRNGEVDEDAYRDFVDWQIEEGAAGLVPCGTTGESPTLSHEEHHRVTEICIEVAAGRVPVVAGTGSNSTEEAISLTRHAKDAGADGALLVMPYYNKPTQEGMYAHYKAVNDAVDIPQIIYNIPGRSVVDMSVETMARLAEASQCCRRQGCNRRPVPAHPHQEAPSATSSASSRARMARSWASSRRAATAASRSPRTSRRASARASSPRGMVGIARRRWIGTPN